MAVPVDSRCSCCRRLYNLSVECTIIIAIILHVLLTTGELLIHLDVIQVPNKNTAVSTADVITTHPPASTVVTSDTYDPGGATEPTSRELSLTVQIFRYATLVISCLFLIEIFCKALYLRKAFFKDPWQVFDLFVVLCSLGLEIAFFLLHDKMLSFHPATEAVTYIIIFRLWRLPRACNIRKKEYRSKLEDEIRYLTQTKMEMELKWRHLEEKYQQQAVEIDTLKARLGTSAAYIANETDNISNGKVHAPQKRAFSGVINQVLNKDYGDSVDNKDTVDGVLTKIKTQTGDSKIIPNGLPKNQHSELERNDSDVNSKANDSGIEVREDSFRSKKASLAYRKAYASNDDEVFEDSDGSETPIQRRAVIQEVEVQIEEISRQKQLPSITKSVDADENNVVLRRKSSGPSAKYFVNAAYDTTGEETADEADISLTYKSADGIPMTDL